SGACNDLNSSAFMDTGSFLVEAFVSNACSSALAAASAATTTPLRLSRLNILIHSEEIIGIVFLLDRGKPLVIVAVGFFHAFFAFVAHQKVHVSSASGIWMNRIVVTLRP